MSYEWEVYNENNYPLNRGDVHVSSAITYERSVIWHIGEPDEYSESVYTFQYTKNIDNPSSMTSLVEYTPQGSISTSDVLYVFPDVLHDPKAPEYFESETYLAKLELVKRYCGWVTGSLDQQSGVIIYRDASNNDRFTMWIIRGFCQRTDISIGLSDRGYWIGFLGDYTANQLTQVFFTYDAIAQEDLDIYGQQVALRMHYRQDPANNNYYVAQYGYYLEHVPPQIYMAETMHSFEVYTSISTKFEEGTLVGQGNYPEQCCWGNMASRDWFNANENPTNLVWLSENAVKDNYDNSEDDAYNGSGNPSNAGGDGGFPDETGDVGVPSTTGLLSLSSLGIVKLYNPSVAQMNDFTNFLFSGITDSIKDTISKLTTDPLQYVIGCYITRFNPAVSSSSSIRFAGVDTGASAPVIVSQFQQLSCGSITVDEATNSHLDYSPYSSAVLYLPYIGYREMNIDEIMKSTLSIYYNIDLATGSCTAYVKVSRSKRTSGDARLNDVLYEFQGNCFVQCPLSSKDCTGIIQALVQAGGIVGSMATHNIAGALSGAVNAVATEKIGVNRNGSPTANYGYSSIQYPYLILQRPLPKVPQKFASYEGWTSNMYKKVSMLKGYTEVDPDTIWTNGFSHATDEETQMIKDIMNGGVYL